MFGEIKTCPFCGREPVVVKTSDVYLVGKSETGRGVTESFSVYCNEYECEFNPSTGAYSTAEAAIEAWNRRGKTRYDI